MAQYGVPSSCELLQGASYCVLTLPTHAGTSTQLGMCAPAALPPLQLLALVVEASQVRHT